MRVYDLIVLLVGYLAAGMVVSIVREAIWRFHILPLSEEGSALRLTGFIYERGETVGLYLIRLLHDTILWPSLAHKSLVSLALQEELRDYPVEDPGPLRRKEKKKVAVEDGAEDDAEKKGPGRGRDENTGE
jgi:hypothetical protein